MYSVQVQVSDGTLTKIDLSIEYFAREDITVYRNLETTPLVLGTDWYWDTDSRINLLTNVPVPAGTSIVIRRNTSKARAFNIYDGGAAFSRSTLDENFRQMIYLSQEFTEGNGLSGVFFPLDMHGFRITNLGDGVDVADAVNKKQLDVVDDKIAALENSFISETTSYPWYSVTSATTSTLTPAVPGLSFSKCALYLNGLAQTPNYSYTVSNGVITLAEPIPAGTMVFARLGEDVENSSDYATQAQVAALNDEINALEARLSAEETKIQPVALGGTGNTTGNAPSAEKLATARDLSVDLTTSAPAAFDGSGNASLGVTGILPTANGGTGNSTGNAPSATKLANARTFSINLASSLSVSYDGTADVALGVSGILPIANGGTGNNTGLAASATVLATSRTFQVNLASTTVASFNGSANVTPGVTGILPIANGGTGNNTGLAASATKLATARTFQVDLTKTTSASFDGTANASPGVTGTLPLGNGGLGFAPADLAALRTGIGLGVSATLNSTEQTFAHDNGMQFEHQQVAAGSLGAAASTAFTWTFPRAFTQIPFADVRLIVGQSTSVRVGVETISTTQITGFIQNTSMVSVTPVLQLFAYGTRI